VSCRRSPCGRVNQIRKQHDGHLLEVVGTIRGGDEPPMVVHRKRVGKAAIYVGKGQSTSSRPPSGAQMPTLSLDGFRLIQTNCPRSNLGR
jgi:hypothetical protein